MSFILLVDKMHYIHILELTDHLRSYQYCIIDAGVGFISYQALFYLYLINRI